MKKMKSKEKKGPLKAFNRCKSIG